MYISLKMLNTRRFILTIKIEMFTVFGLFWRNDTAHSSKKGCQYITYTVLSCYDLNTIDAGRMTWHPGPLIKPYRLVFRQAYCSSYNALWREVGL